MKTTISTIFILLFCFKINAQSTFKDGYYVNNSGDSIQGLIKDLDWKTNPDEIQFKTNSASRIKNLKPEDISFFEISNKVKYKSANIYVDVSENSISDLSKKRLPQFEKKHLFLKVLEEGEANLYQYTEGSLVRYFIETDEADLQQLIYKRYLNKYYRIRENNNFRQQLLNALKCDELSESEFSDLKYKEKSLRKIVSKYNSCSNNSTYSYEIRDSKTSFHLAIRPGIQFATFETKEGVNNSSGTTFDYETSFRVGIELEFILPLNNKKWALILEPTYQEYSSRVDVLVDGFFPTFREAEYASIEIPFGVRYYMFLNKKSQVFVNAGMAWDIGIGDNEVNGNRGARLDLKGSLNPMFGIGFRFMDKFSFEYRLQTGRDLLGEYAAKKSTFTSSQLILGYRLF